MFLIPVLKGLKQISEFETNLVYKVSSRPVKGYIVRNNRNKTSKLKNPKYTNKQPKRI